MHVELKEVFIDSSKSCEDAGSNIPESQAPRSSRQSTSASATTTLKVEQCPSKPIWLGDKTFKCGDPYEAPYPQVDGDPWEKVYRIVKDHDDTMCDAWMDEIQNLLILAGLFSAIVTAFVIETQKLLQEDPATTTALFLAHIASQLAANSSFQAPLPSTTLQQLNKQSLAHAFRINTFLLLSLVMSLSTALFGILVLQWIRSYRKRETLSYKDLLGLRQSRYDGLMKWKVPEIVSALPILLQFGLVVFFVGLVDFLHFLYPTLSIVIGIFVGLVILILILTTILPSLILLKRIDYNNLRYLHWLNRATLCAYQSPQSWIFLKGAYWILQQIVNWPYIGDMVGALDLHFMILSSRSSYYRNWTSFVETMTFKAWTPYSLSWVFQNFSIAPEPFRAAYACFKDLDTPDAMMMVLHDLAKFDGTLRLDRADIWDGDELPSEEFRRDVNQVSNESFKRELFSFQFLDGGYWLAGKEYDGHRMECYMRCLGEIATNASLVKFGDYIGSSPPMPHHDQRTPLLRSYEQHLWYFQCALLQDAAHYGNKMLPSWNIFWQLLDSDWDNLSVITPDEGLSLVYKALTSHDAVLQNHAAFFLPDLIYHGRYEIVRKTLVGRIISNPHIVACLDFLMTDAGRALLCVTFRGPHRFSLEECTEGWLPIMQEHAVDDKYTELFSGVQLAVA